MTDDTILGLSSLCNDLQLSLQLVRSVIALSPCAAKEYFAGLDEVREDSSVGSSISASYILPSNTVN